MSRVRQLYKLQEIDLDLEKKANILQQVEVQLGDNSTLAEAEAELEREQQSLAELKKEQTSIEWEVEDLRAKNALVEEKLYASSMKNPKELLNLQQEAERLKRQARGKEDQVLEMMSQVEEKQKEIAIREERIEKLEREWQEKEKELLVKQAQLKAMLTEGKQRRQDLSSRIDPAKLELYENLRLAKRGQAVAKVEQGKCQGCRIVLSMSEIQRARVGEELTQCSNCERILYLE